MLGHLRRPEKLLSEELEQKYRVDCWCQDIYTTMVCFVGCLILLFLSLWYDIAIIRFRNSGDIGVPFSVNSLVLALRIISILYILIFEAWLYKNRNTPSVDIFEKCLFVGILFNVVMILISEFTRPVWYYVGSVSHVVIVIMLYIILPQHNSYFRNLPPLLFTVGYFFIYANHKQPMPLLGFSGIYFGFIIANILGIIVSYMTYTIKRRNFMLQQQKERLLTLLAAEKTSLEQKNRDLEQEKERVSCYEAELRRQEVQQEKMRTLQAQIKPHFLYNTLSTIAYYCRHQPEQAYQLIGDLSVCLQGAFKFQNELVSLENELDIVYAYLAIESARMEDRLKTEFKIEGDFTDCRLPPFTIEPLVENAVRHGLAPLMTGGTLSVIAREEAACYYFEISDNGIGIPESKLAGLLSMQETIAGFGIGLTNVHARLMGLYGCGLDINSKVNGGTTVCFSIAKSAKFDKI